MTSLCLLHQSGEQKPIFLDILLIMHENPAVYHQNIPDISTRYLWFIMSVRNHKLDDCKQSFSQRYYLNTGLNKYYLSARQDHKKRLCTPVCHSVSLKTEAWQTIALFNNYKHPIIVEAVLFKTYASSSIFVHSYLQPDLNPGLWSNLQSEITGRFFLGYWSFSTHYLQ